MSLLTAAERLSLGRPGCLSDDPIQDGELFSKILEAARATGAPRAVAAVIIAHPNGGRTNLDFLSPCDIRALIHVLTSALPQGLGEFDFDTWLKEQAAPEQEADQ